MTQIAHDFAALGYSKRQSIFASSGIFAMMLLLGEALAIGKQRINVLSCGTLLTNSLLAAAFPDSFRALCNISVLGRHRNGEIDEPVEKLIKGTFDHNLKMK